MFDGKGAVMTACIWLNGALHPLENAALRLDDRGFALGDGLFETLALREGRIQRSEAHWARLRRGATLLGAPLPWDDAALTDAAQATAAANGLYEGVVRLTFSMGPGPRGLDRPPLAALQPTLAVSVSPLPSLAGPVRLFVAQTVRRNERSLTSTIKNLNYLDNILARREAAAAGCAEAAMLNGQGRLACAAAANLFVRLDGTWFTPPVAEGALPGVMRACLLDLWGAHERPLRIADALRAESMALSSALGIRFVSDFIVPGYALRGRRSITLNASVSLRDPAAV
jgi:branched-chain amino acid aminotransferase